MNHRVQWIPISSAADILAERFYQNVATFWMPAYSSAWRIIEEAITSGELPTKSTETSKCNWVLIDDQSTIVKQLESEDATGNILPQFWYHYFEARRRHGSHLTIGKNDLGASHSQDNFWFRDIGLINNLSMSGRVEAVHLLAAAIPAGHGKKKGRKEIDDNERVNQVLEIARSSNIPIKTAVRRLVATVDLGQYETPKATEARLYRKARDRLGESQN